MVKPRHPILANYEGESVFIPKDWTPTVENKNALPAPLRLYIHALETECDPAGTIRQNVLLKDENHALRQKIASLKDADRRE